MNARDVVPQVACADASDTLIYTVTTDQTGTNFRILRFNPSSATFTDIGALVCPDPYEPFSMAVNRVGNAYVLYYDEAQASSGIAPPGNIYRVDLNTAACEPTTYVPNAQFQSFGMAFSADDTGGGETLYIASNDSNPNETTLPPGFLGAIDETTLALTDVGTFTPTVTEAELTGTGDGQLFGFWAPNGPESPGSAIVQINKTNAAIISQQLLPTVTQGNGWAFGFWGGDFYLFTNPGGITGGDTTSIVQRYNPTTGTVTQVASYPRDDRRRGRLDVRAGAVISPGLVSGLAGKRILVTRAREQAEKTAALVRARGGEPVLLPSIELHPPKDPAAVEDALSRAATFAWVAFTSENGVEWTWKVIEGMKPSPGAGIFGEAKLAAIGPSTAAAMEKRGLRPDVVAAESKGEGLAAAVLAAMAPGESLLLLRAQVARDAFPDALVGAGHPVEVVAVYETRPASGPEVTRIVAELERGAIDAVTFTSASTVESFVAWSGEEKARGLLFSHDCREHRPHHERGARRPRPAGATSTPAETTLEALLGALAARFGPTPP